MLKYDIMKAGSLTAVTLLTAISGYMLAPQQHVYAITPPGIGGGQGISFVPVGSSAVPVESIIELTRG
jgi:hypothetical protein